jgi:hypothetical protein
MGLREELNLSVSVGDLCAEAILLGIDTIISLLNLVIPLFGFGCLRGCLLVAEPFGLCEQEQALKSIRIRTSDGALRSPNKLFLSNFDIM